MKHHTPASLSALLAGALRRCTAALAAAIVLGLAGGAAHAAAQKVKVGLIGTNESQLPILVAINEGYFAEQGVTVEPVHFKGGGVAVQALVGGSIDLATFATDHILRLQNRGIDARALIGIDRYITSTLVVRSDAGYADLASLRGQKIGVSAPGSYSDNVVRWAIKSLGLNPDRDFTLIGVGNGASSRAALESGQVQAVSAPTPDVLNFELTAPGKFKVLVDFRDIPHSGQAVIGKQDWIAANPDAARGVARAVLKAEQTIQKDPAVVEKAVRLQFPDRDDDFVAALTRAVPGLLSPDGRISEEGYAKMTEILRTVEPGLQAVDLARVDATPQLLGL